MLSIGNDLHHAVGEVIREAKYDDAPLVARVDGRPGDGVMYHVIDRVSYDRNNNVIVVVVNREAVDYEAIRAGWRPK